MELYAALTIIAERYGLNADELASYCAEDHVGGFHPDPGQQQFPNGSMWAVEGQIIYALIRATRPLKVAEFGVAKGCTTMHILSALERNKRGDLWSVDILESANPDIPYPLKERFHLCHDDAAEWIEHQVQIFDFCVEDSEHTTDCIRRIYRALVPKIAPGAFIVSHDALHFDVGSNVQRGITEAGYTGNLLLLVEPSDCGLSIWRNQ